MPLSFLASFFALNIDGFPRDVDGGVKFGLSWVSCLICKLNSLSMSSSFAYIADFEYSWCDYGIRRAFRDWSLLLRRAEWKKTSSQLAASILQSIYTTDFVVD